jgi:hypothetical protein
VGNPGGSGFPTVLPRSALSPPASGLPICANRCKSVDRQALRHPHRPTPACPQPIHQKVKTFPTPRFTGNSVRFTLNLTPILWRDHSVQSLRPQKCGHALCQLNTRTRPAAPYPANSQTTAPCPCRTHHLRLWNILEHPQNHVPRSIPPRSSRLGLVVRHIRRAKRPVTPRNLSTLPSSFFILHPSYFILAANVPLCPKMSQLHECGTCFNG